MIISEARKKFDGKAITLPDWLLAPLYLQRGTKYWLAHRPAVAAQRQNIYEVVLTTINELHWNRLWKLKLTTEDEPGLAHRLCSVLEEFKIRVLTAECSVHSRNAYNSMSFVLSMQDYDEPLDGFHADLKNPNTVRVAYFELSLLAEMASNIVFHDSGRPRFEFMPMRIHSHFKDGFGVTTGTADARGRGKFVMPDEICAAISETCPGRDIYYAGAVDTEHRLIRILFFPEGAKGVSHVQVSSGELGTSTMRKILGHVQDADANILRFQLRRGLNKPAKEAGLKGSASDLKGRVGPGRFDLTFESAVNARSAANVLARIRKAMKSGDLKGANIHVTEPTD